MLRHSIAIAAGFILWSFLWLGYNMVLQSMSMLPTDDTKQIESVTSLLSLLLGSIVASVVPMTTESITDGLVDATGTVPVVVSAEMLPISLDVDEPQTVGADRMINTLAASKLFGCDTIVVDFGTATTLDCITKDGRFLGGIIAPGVRTAGENLVRKAAKLSSTELTSPEHAIGRRTEDCIRAGLVFGTADAVDGMVRRIKAEWPTRDTPKVIATGGMAPLIAKYSSEIEEVHPDLTLQGLRIASEWLGQAGAGG